MKQVLMGLILLASFSRSFAGDHDPKSIIPLLKTSKVSLLDGIAFAEKTSGVVTSAKYEVENGALMLSVYTVPEGLGGEPETATLTELAGPAASGTAGLKAEVFADKEHIARASVHMTLFKLSKANIKQVIALALRRVPGTPIDIRNPRVANHRAVAEVVIACPAGKATPVAVDLLNGQTAVLP